MRLTIALPDGQWDPRAAVKVVDGGGGRDGGGRVKLSGDEGGRGESGDGAVRFVFAFL